MLNGIGDEDVRSHFAALDAKIEVLETEKKLVGNLRLKRLAVIEQLAVGVIADVEKHASLRDEIQQCKEARSAFESERQLQHRRIAQLLPTTWADATRIAVSQVVLITILVASWVMIGQKHIGHGKSTPAIHPSDNSSSSRPLGDSLPTVPHEFVDSKSTSANFLNQLTADPSFGKLNKYIVAEIDNTQESIRLATKIAGLNFLAKDANMSGSRVLELFKTSVSDARSSGFGPDRAIEVLSQAIAYQMASEKIAKSRPRSSKAKIDYAMSLAGPALVGQINEKGFLKQEPDAKKNEAESSLYRGVAIYDSPFMQHGFLDDRLFFVHLVIPRGSDEGVYKKHHLEVINGLGKPDSDMLDDADKRRGAVLQYSWDVHDCDLRVLYIVSKSGRDYIQHFSVTRIKAAIELRYRDFTAKRK